MSPILLITRPIAQGEDFAEAVRAALPEAEWPEFLLSPLMDIVPVEGARADGDVAGVIFTSQNAVEAARGMDLPAGLPAFCVGQKTAAAAREAGFEAKRGPGDAARLVGQLLKERPAGPLLHIRGHHSRGDVTERLSAGGIEVAEVIAYDQRARPLSEAALAALSGNKPVVLPLFSPRTSTIFQGSGPVRAPLHVVAISPAARLSGVAMASEIIAAAPEARAMLDATLDRIRALTA